MIRQPPREPEWVSWSAFALCSTLIFVSIPLAQYVQDAVEGTWGRAAFAWAVVAAVVVAGAVAVSSARRSARWSASSLAWLLGVGVVFVAYTYHLRSNPEEALHFVEYAVLSVLAFRALGHRLRDPTVYPCAALLAAMVGLVDEAIQWLTPGRYWGLRDVWIDALAAVLAQIALAKGMRPAYVASRPTPFGVRTLSRIAMAAVLLLGASLLNTPERIAWYAERVPFLDYLKTNESMMLEYGYRHVDPVGGPFRSRMMLEELARADDERGEEAAAIVDRYRSRDDYKRFLSIYTPISDPFVHEVRVHLFRRDIHRLWATEPDKSDYERQVHLTVAFRENALLERYFPKTFASSSYVLSDEQVDELRRNLLPEGELPEREVESRVSLDLITAIREAHILTVLALLWVMLWAAGRRWGGMRGRMDPR